MESILSKIYDGEYSPSDEPDPQNERAMELLEEYSRLEDELTAELSGKLKKKFLEYTMASAGYYMECNKEDFKRGFRLAVRLIMEGMGREAAFGQIGPDKQNPPVDTGSSSMI